MFYRWLCGAGDQPAAPRIEGLLIDELARLAQSPDAGAELVPRVPALVPQLLTSLRDANMSGADLSRMLSQDVVLVGEVMRAANSPFYSPRTPLNTIESAVMLLGQNGMRQLLARVAFARSSGSRPGAWRARRRRGCGGMRKKAPWPRPWLRRGCAPIRSKPTSPA